jgi:hypothetical protein
VKTTLLALIAVFAAAPACAQGLPLTPAPRVLQIYRESIRPEKQGPYTQVEIGAAAACARLNFPHPYLTLASITGLTEVWFLNGYDSLTEMEQIGRAIAANGDLSGTLATIASQKVDLVNDPRNIFAYYRPDLSEGRGLSAPRTHLFSVTIVSVVPGKEGEYAEIRKILRSAHRSSNSPEIHSVYQVGSGMREPTFLVFSPATSLEDVENSNLLYRSRFEESLGDANRKRLAELSASAIATTETLLFAVSPPMSFPAKEWVDADPEFWK